MLPTQPYHSLSNHYRRLGGLRELDFYVQSAVRHWESAGEDYRIAVLCNGDPLLALPFLAMGMRVCATFDSDKDLSQAKEIAVAAGLELECLIGGMDQLPEKSFEAIVSSDLDPERLGVLRSKLKDGGRIFVKLASSGASIDHFRHLAQDKGFRVFKSMSLGIFGKHQGIRKDRYFHFTDRLDGIFADLLPESFSRAWLLELFPSSDMPLVIQMLPTFLVGGAEVVAMNLAEKLPELGFETLMLSLVKGGDLESRMRSKGINYIKLERSPGHGRLRIFFELVNVLKNLKPQIVHTHLFASDTWGRLACKLAGVKHVVTTEHNVFCDFGLLGRSIMTLLSGLSNAYVAVSKEVERFLTKSYFIKPEKVQVIYNGIDIDQIKKRPARPFHDVPRLLFVGRLEPQKNPSLLLKALSEIKRPWKLDMAGHGSLEAGLRNQSDELGISARVRFLGNVNTSSLYAEYDAFIFPSLWEGLGLAAIEAAIAGVPIIASDIPPLRELFLRDEIIFVKPGDKDELVNALENVLSKPMYAVAKANELAVNEKWQKFTKENMAASYAHVYRKILGNNYESVSYSAEAVKTSTIFYV